MEERKERLDEVLRYFVIGYLALFIVLVIARVIIGIKVGMFFELDALFYFQDVSYIAWEDRFPASSLTTFGILVGARYIMFGKTYQK